MDSPLLFEGGGGGRLGFIYSFFFGLLLLTFEGGRGHGFFSLFKNKILKGKGGEGQGAWVLIFFTLFLLFYYLDSFFYFCLFLKGEGGHEFVF